MFLATVDPASAHFVSAINTLSGNNPQRTYRNRSFLQDQMVPASTMSTMLPTARISPNALSNVLLSKATCKFGLAKIVPPCLPCCYDCSVNLMIDKAPAHGRLAPVITRSPAQDLHVRTLVAMAKPGPSRPRPLTLRSLTAPARAHYFTKSVSSRTRCSTSLSLITFLTPIT